MRRTILAVLSVAVLAGGIIFLLRPTPTEAQPALAKGLSEPNGVKPPMTPLPVTQVVLFSSGVGYFQREGEVEGNTRIDLTFPVEDINDLLKSMVLQDLGGGHISAVSYDSHDPIDKTLRSFAVNLTNNPTFGQILQQARGEKVEVILQQTNITQPGTLTGTIIGIETQKHPVGKDNFVEVELLNLWCADGMRAAKLTEVQRIRFLNPIIDNELKRALEVMALSHDTQKKAVSISFSGEGKRPVRVGYVVENPIWKTSYRLVLDKKTGKPFLQGWAVVENTSDEDWNNVRMSLVSGRPISFQMDLYQPLYVPRPTVEPELFASLRPVTYGGSMGGGRGGLALTAPASTPATPPMPGGGAAPSQMTGLGVQGGEQKLAESLADGSVNHFYAMPSDARSSLGRSVSGGRGVDRAGLNLKQGVASAASASDMGNFFQYVIENGVSLARQKSAMLPIINEEIDGTKVSIYNQATHAKFPLHGLKFKNTTGLHLMQGPITVFEGNSYAGDSRIQDIQPKEERLISYAIDLGTEVEPVAKRDPDRLTAVKLFKGILYATNKVRESKTYNVKNRAEHDRTLIIEHPFRQDFTLLTPKEPSERSRDFYRFELPVAAGKTASQEVVEERDVVQQVTLSNSNDETIRFFQSSTITSEKVKTALSKAVELKAKLGTTQRELAESSKQLAELTQDQGRLRANLKELPPTAAAYKRYLEKFDTQETEIEKLQDQIKRQRATEDQQRKELDGFLMGLNIE